MSTKLNLSAVPAVLLVAVAVCFPACGTLTEQYVEQATRSIRVSQETFLEAKVEIDNVMATLNLLVTGKDGDVRNEHRKFIQQLESLKQRRQVMQESVAKTHRDGEAYFKLWEQGLETISNEDIRRRSEMRRNSALESYGEIEGTLEGTIESFMLYLSNLKDIKKHLDFDLTTNGINSITEVINKANSDSLEVKDRIDNAVLSLDEVATELPR